MKKIKSYLLKQEDNAKSYQITTEQISQEILNNRIKWSVEKNSVKFKEILQNTAKRKVEVIKIPNKKKYTKWWNEEVKHPIKIKKI